MKKVILMAAVAMLFAATAAAQGKVTTSAKGTPANAVTTCKKDAKCPNASQCQGQKVDATTANKGNVTNARANGTVSKKSATATASKANVDGKADKIKPNGNNSATMKVQK